MIVCTMPFFNELDLLEVKLETMKSAVDVFVVCEATRTYAGTNKPLFFDENKDRFKAFNIKHVIVDNLPMAGDAWSREGFQHDRMAEAVFALKPEITIWSDCDEAVRPEAIEAFKQTSHPVMALEMDWLRYYFNREHNQKWRQRVIARDGVHHVSSVPGMPEIPSAGWHFNYITSKAMLMDKINATSHFSESGTGQFWHDARAGRHPQLDLTTPYDENRLPEFVQMKRERFKDLFLPEGAPLT